MLADREGLPESRHEFDVDLCAGQAAAMGSQGDDVPPEVDDPVQAGAPGWAAMRS